MADAIVRLRVESQEYDQKLQRATQQLQHMEKEVRRTGATFAYADKEELEFIKSLGNMDTQTNSAKGKLREMTDSLLALSQTYKQLTEEEKSSPFGQALAASIDQLKGRASEIKDAMSDMNREIKGMASDTHTFDQIAGSVGLMVSVFQVGQGALQAFGVENEDAAQAIAKLQGVMAITSGLQKIQNALQKESNVMLGVSKVQTLAAAAAETLATKAKQGNVVATKAATVAQKALNLVANANPYILLATAIAAVGTALYAMSKASKQAEEAEEKRLKAEEEAEQRANATRESFVNASAEAMNTASRISNLQTAYMKANTEMEKTDVLKQAQDEFKKLGISCNSVTEAQTLLMSKGAQIIELLRMQGTVAALSAIRMEKYKESFNMLLSNGYDVAGAAALAGYNKEVQELDAQIVSLQTKTQNLKGELGVGNPKPKPTGGGRKGSGGNVRVNVEPVIPKGSLAELEKQLSEAQNKYRMATTDSGRSAASKEIDDISDAIDRMNGKLEEEPAEGSIAYMRKNISKLERDWENAADDDSRKQIRDEIDSMSAALDQMMGKTSAVNITFTEQGISELGKQINEKMGGLEFGSGDYLIAASNLVDFTSFENLLRTALESGMSLDDVAMREQFEKIKMGVDVPDEAWQSLVDEINKKREELDLPPIEIDIKTGGIKELEKEVAGTIDHVQGAASAFQALGNAMGQIDDPGAKVAGLIAEAIGSVAAGYGSATAQAATLGPWAWITFAITGLATMISTIEGIKSATAGNYANGGKIPGNSFSGDNMRGIMPNGDLIGLDAGEVILNRAQQGVIAGQLQSNPMGNLRLSTEISGQNLRVVLNNDNRARGGSRTFYSELH